MKTSPLESLSLIIATLLVARITPIGFAQTTPVVSLDPFEVTTTPPKGYMATNTISGTAMNMPLREVPMAINVITSEFLDDSLVGNLADAFDYNSSITQTFRPQVNNLRQIFAIRGFLTRNILLDGVLAGNEVPTYLIDRIEVVKGPNTLYGQSDPGGLINIVTKRPTGKPSATLTQKFGEQSLIETQLDVNVAPIGDRLAVRVIGAYMDTEGWYPVDGQSHAIGALMADYNLTKNTKILFHQSGRRTKGVPTGRAAWSFERIGIDLNGDGLITNEIVRGIQESSAAVNNTFLPRNFNSSTRRHYYKEDTSFTQAGIRQRISDSIAAQYIFVRSSLDLELHFREYNTFTAAGIAEPNFNAALEEDTIDAHTLNLHGDFETGPVRHKLLAGARVTNAFNQGSAYFLNPGAATPRLRAVLESLNASGRRIPLALTKAQVLAGAKIWEDDAPTFEEIRTQGDRLSNINYSTQDITSFYLTDSLTTFGGRLKLLGGLRYMEVKDAAYDLQGVKASNPVNRDDTSFQVGAVYDLTRHLNAYANYATSFIPNRFNPPTNEFFPPEESEAYEIGLKFEGLWSDRVGGTLSYFNIEKTNVVRTGADQITRVPFTELSADASQGLETELFFNITRNWNTVLNYSHLDAEVVRSRTLPTGLPLEGAPPHRFTFWTSFGLDRGPLKGLRLGGGVVWADGPIQQFGTSNNALVLENGYTEVDLFARYATRIWERNVTFGVNVANATNTFYLRARAMVNDPRQVVFSVKVDL